jgi:hypothetical protein
LLTRPPLLHPLQPLSMSSVVSSSRFAIFFRGGKGRRVFSAVRALLAILTEGFPLLYCCVQAGLFLSMSRSTELGRTTSLPALFSSLFSLSSTSHDATEDGGSTSTLSVVLRTSVPPQMERSQSNGVGRKGDHLTSVQLLPLLTVDVLTAGGGQQEYYSPSATHLRSPIASTSRFTLLFLFLDFFPSSLNFNPQLSSSSRSPHIHRHSTHLGKRRK